MKCKIKLAENREDLNYSKQTTGLDYTPQVKLPGPQLGDPEPTLFKLSPPQEANVENSFEVFSDLQFGHWAGFVLDIDRNSSNFESHSSHLYSKIGIFIKSPFKQIKSFLIPLRLILLMLSYFLFLPPGDYKHQILKFEFPF